MLEDKREFLILMEEQSYLMKSFESTFEKENVKAKVVSIAMATTLTTKEQPQGYLICTSAELLKKAVGVKVIVDHAIKHKRLCLSWEMWKSLRNSGKHFQNRCLPIFL